MRNCASVADAQQSGTRTLLTEIDLPNPDGALRSGVYCTVELKIPRRRLGHAHDRVNARRHAEGRVLRHVDPDADDVLLLNLEHEGAARRVALHQTADIDVALGDEAIERRDDQGVVAVLTELLDQVLLRRDVLLRGGDRGLVCFYGLEPS